MWHKVLQALLLLTSTCCGYKPSVMFRRQSILQNKRCRVFRCIWVRISFPFHKQLPYFLFYSIIWFDIVYSRTLSIARKRCLLAYDLAVSCRQWISVGLRRTLCRIMPVKDNIKQPPICGWSQQRRIRHYHWSESSLVRRNSREPDCACFTVLSCCLLRDVPGIRH